MTPKDFEDRYSTGTIIDIDFSRYGFTEDGMKSGLYEYLGNRKCKWGDGCVSEGFCYGELRLKKVDGDFTCSACMSYTCGQNTFSKNKIPLNHEIPFAKNDYIRQKSQLAEDLFEI